MADRDRRRGPPQVLTVLAVAAVLAHLFGLYRTTGPPEPSWFPYADKLEHLVGFAAPLWLILLARRASVSRSVSFDPAGPIRPSRRFTLFVAAAFVLNAVLSELAQYVFYFHRTGDPFDTLADLFGVGLGLALAELAHGRRRPPKPSSGPAEASAPPAQVESS